MTPNEKGKDLINELVHTYGLDVKQAIEIAMFSVDLVLNYNGGTYDHEYWMNTMDYLDNKRLTTK